MFSRNNEKMEQRVEILEKLFDDMRLNREASATGRCCDGAERRWMLGAGDGSVAG